MSKDTEKMNKCSVTNCNEILCNDKRCSFKKPK